MSDSLRILQLTHYASPHIGGIELATAALARTLSKRGHEVVQLASDAGPLASNPEPEGAEPDAGQVVRLPAWNSLERRADVPYPVFGRRLASELRERVRWADVVHAHGFLYMPSVMGLRLARRLGAGQPTPVALLTEHAGTAVYTNRAITLAQKAAIATLGRYSVRAAEAVTVLNQRVRGEVMALGPTGPVHVIPNGVDCDLFRPIGPSEREALRRELGWDERPRVLFVGRLIAKKGFDLAIEAAKAADGAFELVAVGPGPGLPAAPHVTVMGPLPHGSLPRLYQAADALLLPSTGEGMSLSVLEALASGLHVFLSEEPPDGLRPDQAPVSITRVERDPRAIADALGSLGAGGSDEGGDGVRYVRDRFSWDRVGDRYEAVYRELLQARSTRAPSQPA